MYNSGIVMKVWKEKASTCDSSHLMVKEICSRAGINVKTLGAHDCVSVLVTCETW